MGLYFVGIVSAILVGLSKTGMPGVSIPAITLLIGVFPEDSRKGVVALLPILLVADFFAIFWYRHHARWDRLWGLFPAVAVGVIPGYLVLSLVDESYLRPTIGALILVIIFLEVLRRRYQWTKVPNRWWFVLSMGALAGFSTMVAHAAMPVMTVYLLAHGSGRKEFVGTAAWFFLILNLSKIPFYLPWMIASPEILAYDVIVAPTALIGCFLGVFVLNKISDYVFVTVALALAVLGALKLLGVFDPLLAMLHSPATAAVAASTTLGCFVGLQVV